MSVSVLIPFAGDCEHRSRARDWVAKRYAALGYEVVVGYGDERNWCKADAVADALSRSHGDTLIVADADCWTDKTARVVHAVEAGAVWGMPYKTVHRLSRSSTEQVFDGHPLDHSLAVEHSTQKGIKRGGKHPGVAGGGIVVLTRQLYKACPLDRRFVGWGGEDHAWGYALETLGGRTGRLSGICWHFWHPPQPVDRIVGVSSSLASEQLRLRYADARGNPAAMRELIGVGMRGNATVVIIRPDEAGTDEYGDPLETTATETTLTGAVFAPDGGNEFHQRGREGVLSSPTLYAPPDADILRTDRVRVDGVLYEIDGEPALWTGAQSQKPQGLAVPLRRAEG